MSSEDMYSSADDIDGEDDVKRYTVERKDGDSHLHRYYRKQSKMNSFIKILATILMSAMVLVCMVTSKLTIISIAQAFRRLKPSSVDLTDPFNVTHKFLCGQTVTNSTHYAIYENAEICMREVVFVMVAIILMFPPAFTLVKLLIKTCGKITHPWPTLPAVIWGAIGTILESAGLSLFFVGLVMHVMDTDIVLILMNALFIIPVTLQFTREFKSLSDEAEMELPQNLFKKRRKIHIMNVVLSSIAFVFQTIGIIGILYLLYNEQQDYKQMIIIPCAITLIGIGWSPEIRKLQIDHDLAYVWSDTSDEALDQQKLPTAHRVRYFRRESLADVAEDTESTVASTVSSYDKDKRRKSNISLLDKFQRRKSNIQDDARKVVVQTNTSRGKATLINCIIKLIAIPAFLILFVFIFEAADVTHLHHGLFYLTSDRSLLLTFVMHLLTGIIGYHLSWMGCAMSLQQLCFAIPLTLATPLCIGIILTDSCELLGLGKCTATLYDKHGIVVALFSISLWLGQFFATTYYAWKSQNFVMAEEATLFWVPTYDGTLLEQNMLLNRKNEATNEFFVNYRTLVKKSHVYICTTMYHEADYEMEQFLFSIADVDRACSAERMFECHIWFDDGVCDKTLKTFALQLISLLPRTMQIDLGSAKKVCTPYGMELKWTLPGGLPFHIHLKDTFKVRNKKRWSQVMYMSYVLDHREKDNHDYSYILTTDADVKFHPEDVSALMDFMSRDPSVGAVCGRTKPKGTGPIAWYQIFDYAIDNWLLKVAEHALGSVLSSPGCFSIYRCRAIEDVLPQYASSVGSAVEFLRKDMGEDRWLCTLMLERGWRLDYCASANVTTHCPDEFNEFFKQRRRWAPSRLANQALFLQQQGAIRQSNDDINLIFVVYQAVMLFAAVIGPGTALLIVTSGLNAVFPAYITLTESFCINVVLVVYYVWVCFNQKQEKQLQVAQFMTFLYSTIMTITLVGFMVQIADDLNRQRLEGNLYMIQNATDTYPLPLSVDANGIPEGAFGITINSLNYTIIRTFKFHLTPPTLFLFFVLGIFTTTALLHGGECLHLLHGMWYLLCIPSSYIFLMIFSIANIPDRSWGTREERILLQKVNTGDISFRKKLWLKLRKFCFCCFKEETDKLLGIKMDLAQKVKEEEEERQQKNAENIKRIRRMTAKKNNGPDQKRFRQFDEDDVYSLHDDEPIIFKEESLSDEDFEEEEEGFGGFGGHENVDQQQVSGESIWKKTRNAMKRYNSQRRKDFQWGKMEDEAAQYDYSQAYQSGYDQFGTYIGNNRIRNENEDGYFRTMTIEDWLHGVYTVYVKQFKDAGYDDTTFLMGMKEPDLIEIGIENRGHRKKILSEINRLPPEEIDQDVPENVYQWLLVLGLEAYWTKFEENSYAEPNFLADLKLMDKPLLSKTFSIKKPAHLRKLVKAVKKLKYPTAAQRKIRDAKTALDKVPTRNQAEDDNEEYLFWEKLRRVCLHNEEDAFSQSDELRLKLVELRNSIMVVFTVFNVLWLVIMMAMLNQGQKLKVYSANFLSVAFLAIYAGIMIVQFVSLLIHRVSTWMHFVSRTPFKPGASKTAAWSFEEDDIPEEPEHEVLQEHGAVLAWNLRRRSIQRTLAARERVKSLLRGHSAKRAKIHEVSK